MGKKLQILGILPGNSEPELSWDEVLNMLVETDAIPALTIDDSFLSVDENILIV